LMTEVVVKPSNCATPDCGNKRCYCMRSEYCLVCYRRQHPDDGVAASIKAQGCIFAEGPQRAWPTERRFQPKTKRAR
jgi:hypothetical protein